MVFSKKKFLEHEKLDNEIVKKLEDPSAWFNMADGKEVENGRVFQLFRVLDSWTVPASQWEPVQIEIKKARLVDNKDGTVTDQLTGLLWQRAEDGTGRYYEEALTYCQSLDLAAHHDWRLPRKEELAELATVGFETLKKVFPDLNKERYWAHTMVDELYGAEAPERIAYTIDFDPSSGNYGHPITYFRTYRYYVRAVRDVR